jgi:hypothetical protein
MPKPEQTRWASQEAACKAEINQAKDTFDLVRLANAVARLDALYAEMVGPLPKGVLDGVATPEQAAQYEIVELPEIEIPMPQPPAKQN